MKNLTLMSVPSISSPEAIVNNMADYGVDPTFDWTELVPSITSPEAIMADDGYGGAFVFNDHLTSQAFPDLVPAGNEVVEELGMGNYVLEEGLWNYGVEEGISNFGVVEGMEKNWVVEEESMGKMAAESMVRAAGSDSHISSSGLMDQILASNVNEEYGGFNFHGMQSSSFMGPEWTVGAGGSSSQPSVFGLMDRGRASNVNEEYSGLMFNGVQSSGFMGPGWTVGAGGSSSQPSPFRLMDQGPASNVNEEYGGFMFNGVQSSSFMGPECMVGAGEFSSQPSPFRLMDQGPASNVNEEYGGFMSHGVQSSSFMGPESMVGAGGFSSQPSPFRLMDQGPASNEQYSGFGFHGIQSSSFAVEASESARPAWMVGVGGPPPPASSVLIQTGSGGSDEGYGGFPSQVLQPVAGVEAPREILNLGNKRAAEWMGSAPPGARASKRHRSLSGSIETSGGSSDEAMGSEFSHLAAVVAALDYTEDCWWIKVCGSPGYTDADFKRDFHMRRSTFDALCNLLDPSLRKKETPRCPVPVRTRVAISVFRVATGAEEPLRQLAPRFGIALSTCHNIIREVIDAINTVVQPDYVSARWPDCAVTMADAANKFQALTGGIPGVIGAVYTTHVGVIAPKKNAAEYYNRRLTERRGKSKTSYSVTLHAAVDADGAFTNLCVGNPGAMSDEKIFSLSSMSQKREVDQMVDQGKRLVGGAGYPLTDLTLVPYTHSNLTPPQREFNNKVALARGVALHAFRRLKARWAFLQECAVGKKPKSTSPDCLSSVMKACCVLHNFCERRGDELGDELEGFELEDEEMVVDNPVGSYGAAQVRDKIAHNLFHGATMAVPTTANYS